MPLKTQHPMFLVKIGAFGPIIGLFEPKMGNFFKFGPKGPIPSETSLKIVYILKNKAQNAFGFENIWKTDLVIPCENVQNCVILAQNDVIGQIWGEWSNQCCPKNFIQVYGHKFSKKISFMGSIWSK